MEFKLLTDFISFLRGLQTASFFSWKFYPFIVVAVDTTVAFAPMKNIISQLPLSVSPYIPIIIISSLIVILEIKFGKIRLEYEIGKRDPFVKEKTHKQIVSLTKIFIFIIPSLIIYEGITQCANHYELGSPFISYISTPIKYLALALLSFISHFVLFIFAHKIDSEPVIETAK